MAWQNNVAMHTHGGHVSVVLPCRWHGKTFATLWCGHIMVPCQGISVAIMFCSDIGVARWFRIENKI